MEEESASFSMLFHASYNDILRFMQRRVSLREDAVELAADVFRVAWQKQDPLSGNSRSWLFAIARNVLLDYYRRAARRDAATQRLIDEVTITGALVVSGDEAEHPVLDALSQLPEPMQEVLRLRYWEELDVGEIATVLGISTATARVRLHRARSRVRELLPTYLLRK